MRLLVLVVAAGCVVSRPPHTGERPRWRTWSGESTDDDRDLASCLVARAFVRKSGKQGIGVALQLRSRQDCPVVFTHARLMFDGKELAVPPPGPIDLRGRSQLYAWWPVPFDNNAAWNARATFATLELDYAAAGVPRRWQIEMYQR